MLPSDQCEHNGIVELRNALQAHLPDLTARYHVATLALFGSRVRGEQGPDSDLDVRVTFTETPGLIRFVELENELSDLLGVKVDLVLRDNLKPNIGKRVLAEAVPV